jgi:hypothetical protein
MRNERSADFPSRATGWTTCETPSATEVRRDTSMRAGESIMESASFRSGSGKLAENSRFCLSFGSMARIFRTSGRNPMSSIRSASSRTRISTRERSSVLRLV